MTLELPKTRCKELLCAQRHKSCPQSSSNKRDWMHLMNGWFKCTVYSIQKIKTQKIRDWSKPRHFGQASPTRMTCSIHNNRKNQLWTRHSLAPNKWYQMIHINTRNPEKITKGSKCPGGHQKRGATSSTVHSHSKDRLYLPQTQWLLYNPLVDHSQAIYIYIYIVFKRLWIKKLRDRSQSWPLRF